MDPSDVSMSDVSDDEHGPSDEEDDSMSVDQEDSVSEDEDDGVSDDGVSDDGVSDDEDDEGSDEEEDGVSEGEDDRLPHEKCGLSDYEYVTLSRDQNFGLLEKSAELQDEEADAILDEEAAEAAWPTCCIYLTEYA
ncbi:hypothetical protein J4E83_010490 [Alternaria metachromatica]|uniref:uncharacterized protein n=1 Tax=Alternaria metachromatica TaxID=283354 RepID=UPI0020C3937C|nr:uncharacterized protein J4E83_010490 [Alternaria metachromatica]KAI4605827.1 hypothetical protein J4E83_010490 [Alternaria metachromatica]